MEVISDKIDYLGAGRLGVRDLPGRFFDANFVHFGAKPAIRSGPFGARRKEFLGDAFPLLGSLPCILLLLRTLREPLWPGRRCHLGVISLRGHDQRIDPNRF